MKRLSVELMLMTQSLIACVCRETCKRGFHLAGFLQVCSFYGNLIIAFGYASFNSIRQADFSIIATLSFYDTNLFCQSLLEIIDLINIVCSDAAKFL